MRILGPVRAVTLAAMAALSVSMLWGADARAGEDSAIAVLDRPGEPQLVVAGTSRVVARYDAQPGGFELTLMMSARSLGADVVRSRVRLADGQQHRIILRGEDRAREGDSFTFTRRGDRIDIVAFDGDNDPELALLGN